MIRLLPSLLCLLPAVWAFAAVAAPLRVVASIKPVQSLVAGVMAGDPAPGLVVTGAASPHTYSLRPSDARRLAAADVVFWIGPQFEAFLARPLASLSGKAKVVALIKAPGLIRHPARTGGVWERDGDESVGTDTTEIDGHIWLDPLNAKAMVIAIARTLSEIDPVRAPHYGQNATAVLARLDREDADIAHMLAPVKDKPFIVFHDAYQYFQERYGLDVVGAITVNPDRTPGARRIVDLRAKIKSLGAVCVFAEPQFQPALVQTLVQGTRARTGTLDPEGATLSPGPNLYFELMNRLVQNLVGCLKD